MPSTTQTAAGITPFPVTEGGTGIITATTAYAPICAGTTATGAFQAASTGMSNSAYVLTSNGSSALPSWQVAPGATGGFTKVAIQIFTYTGSPQTYTPTTSMKYCIIEVVGGGGGGGGTANTTAAQVSNGGGGGGGGYSRGVFSAASIGASQTVTIGAAGTAGTINSGTGGTGGTTSVGALISATGGVGGGGSGAAQANVTTGGAGGTGSGGSFNVAGIIGGAGYGFSIVAAGSILTVLVNSGSGGNSVYIGGAPSQNVIDAGAGFGNGSPGGPGTNYGGGGAGGLTLSTSGYTGTTATGGAGSAGIVIITEYI